MKKTAIFSTLLLGLPVVAAAQGTTGTLFQNVTNIITGFGGVINLLIPIIIGLTVLLFFWGLFKYVKGGGKDSAAGKKLMIAGLGALFVEVCLWGILFFVASALGVQGGNAMQGAFKAPSIPGQVNQNGGA